MCFCPFTSSSTVASPSREQTCFQVRGWVYFSDATILSGETLLETLGCNIVIDRKNVKPDSRSSLMLGPWVFFFSCRPLRHDFGRRTVVSISTRANVDDNNDDDDDVHDEKSFPLVDSFSRYADLFLFNESKCNRRVQWMHFRWRTKWKRFLHNCVRVLSHPYSSPRRTPCEKHWWLSPIGRRT